MSVCWVRDQIFPPSGWHERPRQAVWLGMTSSAIPIIRGMFFPRFSSFIFFFSLFLGGVISIKNNWNSKDHGLTLHSHRATTIRSTNLMSGLQRVYESLTGFRTIRNTHPTHHHEEREYIFVKYLLLSKNTFLSFFFSLLYISSMLKQCFIPRLRHYVRPRLRKVQMFTVLMAIHTRTLYASTTPTKPHL